MLKKPKDFIVKNYRPILTWVIIFVIIALSYYTGFDKRITAALVILIGIITQIFGSFFTFLINMISLIPFVGPLIAKILTWPFFITINGLSFIITFFAIKKGEIKEVFNSRVVVYILLAGIVIGYILGKIF